MSTDDHPPRLALATPPNEPSAGTAPRAVGALEDTARSSDPRLQAACFSDEVIAAHLEGTLEAAERERFGAHLDGCEACRAVVLHAARAIGAMPQATPGLAVEPSPRGEGELPRRVGRFTILEQLGAGGMGVVYAAYDTQLDRKVAVKLVRTDLRDHKPEATRRAMLREAKAMAKVEHPNVITVYEVGTLDDQVFVAMELVTGGDLRAWMTRAKRTWRETLDICVQAGRGLAAAHRANLVHRDFKPDNVLVGSDGRVRVTDFGLARPVLTPSEPIVGTIVGPIEPDAAASDRLTRTGALVGTPAYMAPEQHRAEPADERSDQFAFCVTAWEALFHERPFEGTTYAVLAVNVSEGTVRTPSSAASVPQRIQTALRRGLSVRPAERFPTMDALLAALSDQRGRTLWITAGAVALVGATIATTWAVTNGGGAGDPGCPAAEAKLAGIWDAARRDATARALTAAGPFGTHAAHRTTKALDAYAERWAAAWSDTCKTSRGGEQSATMFDLRVACLTRRLRALDTFVATLGTSDAVLAAKAGALVDQLDPVAPCNDTTALTRVAPPAPAVQAAVATLEATLERASALRIRGRYDELRPLLAQLSTDAQRLGYRPFAARAVLALGTMQVDVGEYAEAEKSLQRASSEAIAANDDWLAASALVSMVDVVGYQLGRPAEAHRLADLARASLERAGDPVQLRLSLLNAISRIHMLEGKHDAALAAIDRALELASADEAELITALSAKGVVLFELGRYDEARAVLARELELRGRAEGPHHPNYASALENRANLHFVANDFERGVADLREARRIKVAALGEATPEIVNIENNLGVIAGLLGDWDEALRASRVALALSEKRAGPEHPTSAKARANIGAALRELGKLEQADVELAHALRLQERVLGAEHHDVGVSLQELAELRLTQSRPRDAIPLFERAHKIFVTALGADNPQVGYATSGLGRAQLAAKDVTTARATLATTVAALEQTGVDPLLLARTRLALAEATWQLGERSAAVAIAARAEPDLAKLPAGSNQRLRAAIAAWRASHGR